MTERISSRLMAMPDKQVAKNLRLLLEANQDDLTALRTAFVALTAKLDVLTAKLNADGGVTDTNYATNFASTLDPDALTFTK